MPDLSNDDMRAKIAQLMVGRCTNCYDWITDEKGKYTTRDGKWIGQNTGPFCQHCFETLIRDAKEMI